ncbi:NnrS family protein [Motiliproteus sp. MSK22-1]|uniref:NnrS family protein n=1 Tax=Motiliproteus sp. MSK22-1 TaxID=1897630 RepID=UPI000976FA6E|nr:NnrS family protein [Motiliproteus sp. MSK22-1]OMH29163.1 hypothetical protein BGP75_20690 [Motiliproteus sp. MSK22-1]
MATSLIFEKQPKNRLELIFSNGFRPLFICTALSALILLLWWISYLYGYFPSPSSPFTPLAWHSHEMLFAFIGSAIGGFLLAAVAKWSGRAPVSGLPLILLVSCWIVGRIAISFGAGVSPVLILVADSSYWLLLTILVGREILISRNYRNLKVVLVLSLFTLLNSLFHLNSFTTPLTAIPELQNYVGRAALMLVCLLISLIGGRIIPAFTGNWLKQQQLQANPKAPQSLPAPFGTADITAVIATILLAFCWTLYPEAKVTAVIAVIASTLQIFRLARWQSLSTLKEPMLLSLHIGYAWIGIGFLIIAVSIFSSTVPVGAAIHALSVGAMAGLILAVAARAALGHTNRLLKAGKLMTAAFVVINLAALTRILASLFPTCLPLAAVLWLLAFLLFALRYLPILLSPAPHQTLPK